MKSFRTLIFNTSLFLVSLFPFLAHASNTGMPWESPLEKVVNSITGPVAFGVSVVGIVAAGASLIFGNAEMSGFIKMLVGLVLIIAFIVLAVNILSSVFGISSTVIL
ncbi:conjugal transfer protein TrbC [Photobacterium damselae subsp. piscicida]|uniref:TrbC/VirB2 family protein n=1 Tax=Photobacterium damselae TaxID=38293 RepID=UPI001075ED4D|nr:TrbC/VirB2 family protein [Photobacterium damselae]TFZ62410.1 conjugal transfer protein TrbC [Photobacterium damselae subsp. piscicida]